MHVTHMFQVCAIDKEDAEISVQAELDDTDSHEWDYYNIEGSLDVKENKYYPSGKEDSEADNISVESVNKELEEYCSMERYEAMIQALTQSVVEEDWWRVHNIAKTLYEIKAVAGHKFDLANVWENDINGWDFTNYGISALTGPKDPPMKKFIVFVDFHI